MSFIMVVMTFNILILQTLNHNKLLWTYIVILDVDR